MLSSLLDRIRGGQSEAEPEPERLVPLAAATLLVEVAWADHNIGDGELDIIRSSLTEQFELTEQEVEQILTESRDHHDESVGLYSFTRTLVEAWDEPQRFELVMRLWKLAYSDAHLDRFEEHMIRKIAELLYVSHSRFIEAKRRARDSGSE